MLGTFILGAKGTMIKLARLHHSALIYVKLKGAFTIFKNFFILYCACILSHFSRVQLFMTLQSVARQVPLSLGFSRQEYWSGLPFPSPGDPPDPGLEPTSPMSPALTGGSLPLRHLESHFILGFNQLTVL